MLPMCWMEFLGFIDLRDPRGIEGSSFEEVEECAMKTIVEVNQ